MNPVALLLLVLLLALQEMAIPRILQMPPVLWQPALPFRPDPLLGVGAVECVETVGIALRAVNTKYVIFQDFVLPTKY